MITVIFHSHWIQTMTTQNYTNFINKVKYVSSFDSQWESTIKDPEFQDNLTPIISKPKLSGKHWQRGLNFEKICDIS